MRAQQPGLSARARWIIRTQLAAISPGRKHTPGVHTRAIGFIPFTAPARDSVTSRPSMARERSTSAAKPREAAISHHGRGLELCESAQFRLAERSSELAPRFVRHEYTSGNGRGRIAGQATQRRGPHPRFY